MSFLITIAGLEELASYQMSTDIFIDRRLYDHSRAWLTLEWDEDGSYSKRDTAALAAKALNSTVDVSWKGKDATENTECFHGYVEQASGERTGGTSRLTLECVSMSRRTDLVPRYRAFQACTLQDICRHIAGSEPLIAIERAADLDFDIPLSIQYGETDYAYLRRMLHAWGVPLSVLDKTGKVMLGARGTGASAAFPGADFRWQRISFIGGSDHYPNRENSGSGPTNQARAQVAALNSQLGGTAAGYHPIEDAQLARERLSAVQSQVSSTCYRLVFEDGVLPFSPGEVVQFEGQDMIIRQVRISGGPSTTAAQEFELQAFTLPYQPDREMPAWPSRALWAHVVANENDPAQQGRIQVKFDLEELDPGSVSERAWLHLLTPYAGVYSVPEVGERVLVQFVGDWDAEAVVLGTVRDGAFSPMYNPNHSKRWRTPSGNEVALTTKGGTDVVRIRCQDQIMFESKIEGGNTSVYITAGESEADMIHFQKGAGPPRLDILCSGQINVKADQKLHLEGQQVQITATAGNVNIDGMPNVMINCVATPMVPLQVTKFEEDTMSTSSKTRKLPKPIGA